MYDATDKPFRDFLFAAIHTGLRPFCELARLTADHVEEMPRGMMWRVYSSKTKKTRKIPVRPEVAALSAQVDQNGTARERHRLVSQSPGQPMEKGHRGHRFMTLRRKLGWEQTSSPGTILDLQRADTRLRIGCCRATGMPVEAARSRS